VIFTGSLTPIDGFQFSDGGFNLGVATALLRANKLPTNERVLATMNGIAVPGRTLEKDLTTATFSGNEEADDILRFRKFLLVPAGGTIDFVHNKLDSMVPAKDSAIPNYLRTQVRLTRSFDAMPPILKDSRSLTKNDISEIVDVVRNEPCEHILITTGLIKIGALRSAIKRGLMNNTDSKVVVITGSRDMIRDTGIIDATHNLGFAYGNMGLLDPGSYIALAGQVVPEKADPLSFMYTPDEISRLLLSK
jgi:hypothetical protein